MSVGFEGPEKLLEIWFSPTAESLKNDRGLCAVPRSTWEPMLDLVHCKILSIISNEQGSAYLLSESSMYVYPHKLILKTCGTTTLLCGLPRLLEIAAELGLKNVWRFFYSRKSFMFPDRQTWPHKTWSDENGSAYAVGRLNGDHWNLYMTTQDPEDSTYKQLLAEMQISKYCKDQTLEILMTDLDPKKTAHFYLDEHEKAGSEAGKRAEKQSGLTDLLSDTQLDSYLFEPCGFSLNSIHSDQYATVHVTPEPECSFASFESNLQDVSLTDMVYKVVGIFNPGKFSVTVFCGSAQSVITSEHITEHDVVIHHVPGWKRTERIVYDFRDYKLGFMHFERLKE